jgi:hypothetical protein
MSESRDKPIQSADEKGNSGKQENQPQDKIGASVGGKSGLPPSIPPAIPKAHEASNEGKPTHHQSVPNWVEKWTLVLEFAGVIGLAFYCWVNWREWRTFDSERQTMESEFKASQAVADNQLREMQQSRVLDERAWISIKDIGLLLPYSAEHVGISLNLVNTGKTPAYMDSFYEVAELVSESSTNILYKDELTTNVTIAPNGNVSFLMNEPDPIGEDKFEILEKGGLQCVFVVKIVYRDAFGNIRHTFGGVSITGAKDILLNGRIAPSFGPSGMD